METKDLMMTVIPQEDGSVTVNTTYENMNMNDIMICAGALLNMVITETGVDIDQVLEEIKLYV